MYNKIYYSRYTKGQAVTVKHARTDPAIHIPGVEWRLAYRKLLPSFPWKLPPYTEILNKGAKKHVPYIYN